MLDNPMLQNLYSNPDMIRTILTSNPQFQQLVERNPELNHMLSNPEILRQSMEMMRNPSAFQELMRTHDRALSNLESLPGGYNALRRMYTELQEPILNAAQEQFSGNAFASNAGSTTTSTTSTTENREPLPNPWDRSSTTNSQNSTTTNSVFPPSGANPMGSLFNNSSMQQMIQQITQNPELVQSMQQTMQVGWLELFYNLCV